MPSTVSPKVATLAERWLRWDQDTVTRQEVEVLLQAGNEPALQELLGQRLEFGECGLGAVAGTRACGRGSRPFGDGQRGRVVRCG